MIFESGFKYEHMLPSEIEINPAIITLSEGGSIQETLWDGTDRWDTKIQSSEHPQKGDMEVQPGMKLMGSRGPWWMKGIHLELGIDFFPQIHIKYRIHVNLPQQEW